MQRELPPDYPQRIRRLRERFALTQVRLAKLLGVSVASITRWEQGQTRPTRLAWSQITRAEIEGGGVFGLGPGDSPTDRETDESKDSTPAAPPTNLRAPLTSFIGRTRELREVHELLDRSRILTVTGPGGSGKTRLALETVARTQSGAQSEPLALTPESFADGIWLVELEGIAEGAHVAQAVAAALGVRESRGQPLDATLQAYLRRRRLLLVLDNCEHLLDACATVAARLLGACPEIRILATSREPLGIAGETTWQIPPLSLPASEDSGLRTQDSANRAGTQSSVLSPQSSSEAVQLFVERARAVQPGFVCSEQNMATIEQICRRLDGIPLAIELAAARVRVLTPEQILERLEDRFRLLVGGTRMAPPRHQTLRAAVDWSYDLLSEPEQRLFRRLSVFARGFRIEAVESLATAQEVSADPSGTSAESSVLAPEADESCLDLLTRLVEKSLVVMDEAGGRARYRLLETLREYGRERLAEQGETAAMQRLHADYCLSLVQAAEPKLNGAEQGTWMERLDEEYDDLRAALAWCMRDGEDAATALRLAGALALSGFWMRRGYLSEGRAWCQQVLQLGGRRWPRERAKILTGAGSLARHQGDFAAAQTLAEQSLEVWQELDDAPGIARALVNLGNLARGQGDLGRARELHEEALEVARESGNPSSIAGALEDLALDLRHQGDYAQARALHEECLDARRRIGNRGGIAAALNNLAAVARDSGDYTGARLLFEESLAIARELRLDWGIALVLANLGVIANRETDARAAAELFRESLEIRSRLGDRPGIAECFGGLALASATDGRFEEAARLLASLEVLREETGSALPPAYEEDAAQALVRARSGLGAAEFAAVWTLGRAMPLAQAIASALSPPPPSEDDSADETAPVPIRRGRRAPAEVAAALTRREREILRLIAAGRTNQGIADEFILSIRTVENHIANLYAKIGVHTRGQAVAYALQRGIAPAEPELRKVK